MSLQAKSSIVKTMSTLFTFLLLQVFARPMTGKKHDKILKSLLI